MSRISLLTCQSSAVSQWRPSRTEARVFVGEVLSQLQALANTVATLAELRAVELDSGAVVRDFVDAVDTWRLCDLAASLVEVTRIAVQRLDHCDTCVDQDTVAVELGENDD